MSTLDQARETQLRNIESKTGKTLAQLRLRCRAAPRPLVKRPPRA